MRLNRWQEFRRHIALRCKVVFQYHLSNRGYYGKILFDHVQQTLQLKACLFMQIARHLCYEIRFKLMIKWPRKGETKIPGL